HLDREPCQIGQRAGLEFFELSLGIFASRRTVPVSIGASSHESAAARSLSVTSGSSLLRLDKPMHAVRQICNELRLVATLATVDINFGWRQSNASSGSQARGCSPPEPQARR